MTAPPVLLTIPISHYCEKARWALDRAGIAYEERRHVQVFHRVAAMRAARSKTVPVLLGPGVRLTESADIVAWAAPELYPAEHAEEIRALEAQLDESLGPAGRLWMYHSLRGWRQAIDRYNLNGVPRWQARAFRAGYPLFQRVIDRVLDVNDETAIRSLATVRDCFDEVARRLEQRRFLAGERFTAADLTFASLSASVLLPPEYGVPLPTPSELPPEMAEVVEELRAHPAGAHALEMFRTER